MFGGDYVKTIFHIDVNSAFLSWEAAKRLSLGDSFDLRTVPSAVGGSEKDRRGIILAKSFPAKSFNIKTGETIRSALEKCPELLIVKPDYLTYRWYSNKMFELLCDFSDKIERYSIDECFLDYTGMENIYGPALNGAELISSRIKNELGFTVNIGISKNKILAKMAGELEKPDKIHTLWPYEIEEKMWPLPVNELFMAGRRTCKKLNGIGIYTIGDLAKSDINVLRKHFKSYADVIYNNANGIGSDLVGGFEQVREIKSMGNSSTLPYDVKIKEDAYTALLSLSEIVSSRLRDHGVFAGEIAVNIKTSDFKMYSHMKKLSEGVDCTNAVFLYSCEIFNEMWNGEPLRQIGIRAERFSYDRYIQLSLFGKDWDKNRKADIAADKIRLKYGNRAVIRSALLDSPFYIKDRGRLEINNTIF